MKAQDMAGVEKLGEKYSTPAAMAALIEDHADHFGGADRLAVLLDGCMNPREWARLTHLLSTDILIADQGGYVS